MSKFKVGDRVRSENTGYGGMSKMTEGIVVETPRYESNLYRVKIISGMFRDDDEWSKEFFTNASSWSFREGKLEPFSFKVGDEVEVIYNKDIKGTLWREAKIGLRGIITEIDQGFYIIDDNKYYTNFTDNMLKLIKGGSTMCGSGYAKEKSLRDRIEALTGWTKEADDIIKELTLKRGYSVGINIREDNSGRGQIIADLFACGNKKFDFLSNSQCSKLRAFKDALLYLLDESGLEKVDKEKETLLKQIADLKSSHEQEGRRIEELERKANGR